MNDDPGTFVDESDRSRLQAAAVKAVVRLTAAWRTTNAEGAALLGVSKSTWDRIKGGSWGETLSQDQLTRASLLIGIYEGLHLLFVDTMADRWPGLPNRNPLLCGLSPVQAMIVGGIPRMLEVRCYIESLTSGVIQREPF